MNKRAEIFLAARDLIKDERNWSKVYFAQNDKGEDCDVTSQDASTYCVLGSVLKAVYSVVDKDQPESVYFYRQCKQVLSHFLPTDLKICNIVKFNDSDDTSHKDVINLLTKAIGHELSCNPLPKTEGVQSSNDDLPF